MKHNWDMLVRLHLTLCSDKKHKSCRCHTFFNKVLLGFILFNESLCWLICSIRVEDFIQSWITLLIIEKVHKLFFCEVRFLLCTSETRLDIHIYLKDDDVLHVYNILLIFSTTTYTKFINMADTRKKSGVSYRQHGVEVF